MKKVPYGKYSKELREEAIRLMVEDGMTAGSASKTLGIPKSTLTNWLLSTRRLNFVSAIVNRGHRFRLGLGC